ncbi:ABC transporter ATP-binding protein [Herbaspirillum aquaticum]|uniref:ABC transporter ATP-binding protein n=1 Tax=Herbaspirillum aquaticum TaxID=568783 RepID=UPI0024DE70DC|nr:ATP-binding cassette domain-containing protein [Herbaspirillum aquaticum]
MLLQLSDVRKSYRDNVVLHGASLSLAEGELVGMIGPNGAGKSTLFGTISGEHRCDAGKVLLDGADITSFSAEQRCWAGIGRTFQIPRPFLGITVYENALVAATFGAGLHGRAAAIQAVDAIHQCGLAAWANRPAAQLTLLQRKRLELARAIATRPRLLLLDEIAGGLTDGEVAELLLLVQSINRTGTAVLWIEHLVHALVAVVSRLVVLSEGRILDEGDPQTVLNSRLVRETYLGSDPALDMESDHAAR